MEGILGEIKLVCHSFDMKNYMSCDGRTLKITEFMALYALIVNNFGGTEEEGVFCLPILTSPLPNLRYVICVNGVFPSRD